MNDIIINFENEFNLVDLTDIESIKNDEIILKNAIKIYSHHEQDCCEHVYANINYIKDEINYIKPFNCMIIEIVEGSGIRLKFGNNHALFVPCYDIQNGYYSSNLELIVEYKHKKCKYNITPAAEYKEEY